MTDYTENTRRIAKNTLMLYFRMFFLMLLGLFTSRIVLESLGESDFGIYSVVGGVVAMFSIISGALSSAVSRFISYELGLQDNDRIRQVYSTSVIVMIIIAVIVAVIAEPSGLWFIDNKMNIDPAKIPAARWVLHFSIASFVINLISVPQMAAITAHEKMQAYAYIGIIDGLLRLGTAYLITLVSSNGRLVMYAALMLMTVLMVRMCYIAYCRRNIPKCRFRFIYDKGLLKEMFSFAGWEFIGTSAGVLRDQGGNILINIFFGTVTNAARGVAVQLNSAVQGFVTNFMTAVNPQITKSYAAGDHNYTFSLVRKAARMSYYLILLFALPLLFNTEFVLELWLKEVPADTVMFARLFLIFSLCESIARPLITALLAQGNIRNYQIIVGGLQLLTIPVCYMLFRIGLPAESSVAVSIVMSLICILVRLLLMKRTMNFPVRDFLVRVFMNVVYVTAAALIIPLSVCTYLPDTFICQLAELAIVFVCSGAAVFFVGCSASERRELLSFIFKRFIR